MIMHERRDYSFSDEIPLAVVLMLTARNLIYLHVRIDNLSRSSFLRRKLENAQSSLVTLPVKKEEER